MYPRNRLGAIGAALISVGVLAGATAAPARAATQAPAAGSILCSGAYLCLQTVSVNTTNHTAQVNAWAATKALPGYFILDSPPDSQGISEGLNSPTRVWPAGGTHYTFTVWLLHGTYYMSAVWGSTNTIVDSKGFGINF